MKASMIKARSTDKEYSHSQTAPVTKVTTYLCVCTVGDYKDDMPNGNGVYTYASGDTYDGDWVNGKRHGTGSYTYSRSNAKVCR